MNLKRIAVLLIAVTILSIEGCSLKAIKKDKNTMELQGFMGGEAEFEGGGKIKKDTWFKVPDFMLGR